jgi:hypothetical protein
MDIFFDESGTFNPSAERADNLAFVVGVIIPEGGSLGIKNDFDWFVSKLGRQECIRGEPKGALLSLDHRKVLLEILKSHSDVMLIPVTVNLGQTEPEFMQSAPTKIRALIEGNLEKTSTHMTVTERRELAKRFGNLSAPVLARIVSYGIAVLRSIEALATYYTCAKFHRLYDPIQVTFDRAAKPNSREELVFKDSVFGWVTNWSLRAPLRVHGQLGLDHPLFALYGENRDGRLALDLRKILFNKIDFRDSRNCWQIQLADFLANTWARVILDYEGKDDHRPLFRELYKKAALTGNQSLGLVGLTDSVEVVPAPLYLNVFPEMVSGVSKVTPCN